MRERGGKKGIESDDRFYLTTMAASAIGKLPTEYRWYRIMLILAATQELCDNLVNALKLLSNQLKDGNSPDVCVPRKTFPGQVMVSPLRSLRWTAHAGC